MSMRGVQAAKFVYDLGGENEAAVMLNYVNITKMEYECLYIEHEASIDAERGSYLKGVHLVIEWDMNLYKYGNPASKYNEIIQFLGKKVALWLHRDGQQFKTKSGNNALFLLKEFRSYYKTTTDYKDGLILTFVSQNPIDPALPDPIVVEPNEIIMLPGVYL